MGFYSRHIFPRLMHWSMSRPGLAEERRRALADVRGDVLEIGFGTGLNLPHYPEHVRRIVAVDANAVVLDRADEQVGKSGIEVERFAGSSERLPLPDGNFDSVVSTFTLCSIRDVAGALGEVRRVLRPGGRFFFLEHGLSSEPRVARWQHRFTPLTRWLGEGCHLDRPIRRLIDATVFQSVRCEEYVLPSLGKLGGYLYRGVATK